MGAGGANRWGGLFWRQFVARGWCDLAARGANDLGRQFQLTPGGGTRGMGAGGANRWGGLFGGNSWHVIGVI